MARVGVADVTVVATSRQITLVCDLSVRAVLLSWLRQGNLRRMVYLFLKEVAESTDAAEVIIVVQSLCKDMNNNVDIYRSNAIRTLAKIIDVR